MLYDVPSLFECDVPLFILICEMFSFVFLNWMLGLYECVLIICMRRLLRASVASWLNEEGAETPGWHDPKVGKCGVPKHAKPGSRNSGYGAETPSISRSRNSCVAEPKLPAWALAPSR